MIKEMTIEDFVPHNIKYGFHGEEIPIGIDDITLSVITLDISGHYPDGSQGARTGEFLRGVSVFLREVFSLDALVIDLRELDYRWGDNLLRVAFPQNLETSVRDRDSWIGYKIIGSQKNKDALYGLFCDFGKSSGIKKIYTSVDDAIQDIVIAGKELYKDSV